MTDIEHCTAEELATLAHGHLLGPADCEILADALLTVTYIKHLKDKAERNDTTLGKHFVKIYEEILKHGE